MDSLDEYIGVGWENEPSRRTPVNAYNLGIMEDGIKRLFAYLIAGGGTGSVKDGREVELRNSGEYIQWRYSGEEDWTNLVALADLKGKDGDNYVLTDEDIEDIASKVKVETSADKITYDDSKTQLGETNVQDAIGKLSGQIGDVGKPTDEQINSAINEYLSKNPVEFAETDPTVPDWAKQATKPAYTADEVGALPKDTKIPTALPNPYALKFTGAVEAEYNGTKEVTVAIPSGGSDWQLLYSNTLVLEEAVSKIIEPVSMSTKGMKRFFYLLDWTKNEYEGEMGNDNIMLYIGNTGVTYGRGGDPTNAGNSYGLMEYISDDISIFQRATASIAYYYNVANVQSGLENSSAFSAQSGLTENNFVIGFFRTPYKGTLKVIIYGK